MNVFLWNARARNGHVEATLNLFFPAQVYCIFPGVAALVVRYWRCRSFEESSTFYLIDDLRVQCDGPVYKFWELYASLMVVVWPLGAPALLYVLCWRHRDRIDPFGFRKGVDLERAALHLRVSPRELLDRADAIRENDPVIGPTRMIWIPYEPEFWYFESVETIRRLGYTVASAVIPEGGMLLVFLVFITCASLKMYSGFRPFAGQEKGAKFPTSKAPISVVFHSFWLIFGRVIISRNGLEA